MKKRRPLKRGPVTRVSVNLNAGQVAMIRNRAHHDTRTMSAWIRNLILSELAK